jgi:hypothetical protein
MSKSKGWAKCSLNPSPSWRLHFEVSVGDKLIFEDDILVYASWGGEAKSKVWPKFRNMALELGSGRNNGKALRFEATLQKCFRRGSKFDLKAPVYVLKEAFTHYDSIASTGKSSKAFKVQRNGYNRG